MKTAKVIPNGGSQAVRLPKEYRFEENEVLVNRVGDVVMLFPKTSSRAKTMIAALDGFTDDFMNGVDDLPIQDRALI